MTARELVTAIRRGPAFATATELARRVDAVLELVKSRHAAEAYDAALRDVVRVLNGMGDNATARPGDSVCGRCGGTVANHTPFGAANRRPGTCQGWHP